MDQLTRLVNMMTVLWNSGFDKDENLWNSIHDLLLSKMNELELYNSHSNIVQTKQLPLLGLWSVLPAELSLMIFTYLSLFDVVKSISVVCSTFYRLISYKQEQGFWCKIVKDLIQSDVLVQKEVTRLSKIDWSISQKGWFNVGKTLLLQSRGKVYQEWTIIEGTSKVRNEKSQNNTIKKIPDGAVYEGQWRNGKLEGVGKYSYPDGGFYIGDFKDNRFEGKGTRRYLNGEFYEGQWKDGNKHGKGRVVYPDGRAMDEEWYAGKKLINPNNSLETFSSNNTNTTLRTSSGSSSNHEKRAVTLV
eukprot:TRINITY_DN19975_c0_g1_i1.p1 TRINITY_DN19975_c0_g1~~TRINITY_DN19975_c0_g1_i1.p1  ORF type:complete len:302 (+),score=54.53 TRINITY_DN19975_c0_g1_i1:163-1068(+)